MAWTDFQKQLVNFSPAERERIRRAYALGEKLHGGQKRMSGEPYFSHPIAVAKTLLELDADADTVIAALLHDTAEDTLLSAQEIGAQFDGDVAVLIEGLTKLTPEDVAEQPRLNEQVETLRKMFTLMEKDVRLMVVKLADRLHNMRTVEFLPPERRRALAQETMDVYVKIADRLCMQDMSYELEELALAILDPPLHAQLLRLREKHARHITEVFPLVEEGLRATHADLLRTITLHHEQKPWGKLRAQMETKGTVVTGLAAVTIAFVCADRESCYRLLGALHEEWKREGTSFQDFINAPVLNGYQGLHTTIILSDGTRVRCKIRTEEMEAYSHRGVTLFCFRPEHRELLASLLPWTKQLSFLTKDTKERSADFWESLQSDILCETITIYGPNDETSQLPKGATVLDGAFYLFQEHALRLKEMKVNGNDVPLSDPLKNGVALDPTFGKRVMAAREWIPWVQTRFASAMIRGVLEQESQTRKIATGKCVLQRVMDEYRTGFLEEFNSQTLGKKAQTLGYDSLEDALTAVATGRLDPHHLHQFLFASRKQHPLRGEEKEPQRLYDLRLRLPPGGMQDSLILDEIKAHCRSLSLHTNENDTVLRAVLFLTASERKKLLSKLATWGLQDPLLTEQDHRGWYILAAVILTVLWGLDPVFARLLIQHDSLTAVDLTLLRFWTLAVAFLGFTLFRRRRAILQPLNLKHPLLWLSAVLMVLVAFTTYVSLQQGRATHYEIVMAASSLLIATAFRTVSWKKGLLLWMLFALSLFLLIRSPLWNLHSAMFTTLALACFAAFLAVSNRYMQQEMVAHRTLEYFTAMLIIGSLCTLPLFAIASPMIRDPGIVLRAAAFSIIFIGFPYYLYYEVPPKRGMDAMIPFGFIMLSATIAGEIILTHRVDLPTLLAGAAMMACTFLLERKQQG